jgi:4-hydroxy-tetrahydrodipicolinate reductase
MQLDRDDARDVVEIEAAQPIVMMIPGGLQGDTATAAIVANAIPRVLDVRPGLRTMADLPALRSVDQA